MTILHEVWRHVQEFDRYEVSNLGRIKSHYPWRKTANRILKPCLTRKGYHAIWLKSKCVSVHRIVALAFVENRRSKAIQINHINGIKTDNRAENLEWCTNQENCIHAMLSGKGASKLKPEHVLEIRKLSKTGMAQFEIAKMFEIGQSQVSRIASGKRWNYMQ